jgi:rubrerythrin
MLNENEKELKALIKHEKKNIQFYVRYHDILREKMSERELEKRIDFHLDRLNDLLKQLKK